MLCVWLTATVRIQKTVIIIKESDILQVGRFILELAELETDVAITNMVSISPPEPRKGSKMRSKLQYLIQFIPRELAIDPSQCDTMKKYPEHAMASLESRLKQVIKQGRSAIMPICP